MLGANILNLCTVIVEGLKVVEIEKCKNDLKKLRDEMTSRVGVRYKPSLVSFYVVLLLHCIIFVCFIKIIKKNYYSIFYTKC